MHTHYSVILPLQLQVGNEHHNVHRCGQSVPSKRLWFGLRALYTCEHPTHSTILLRHQLVQHSLITLFVTKVWSTSYTVYVLKSCNKVFLEPIGSVKTNKHLWMSGNITDGNRHVQLAQKLTTDAYTTQLESTIPDHEWPNHLYSLIFFIHHSLEE